MKTTTATTMTAAERLTADQENKESMIEANKPLYVWFLWSFGRNPEHDPGYYAQWSRRYNKGLESFINEMDSKRRDTWKQITKLLCEGKELYLIEDHAQEPTPANPAPETHDPENSKTEGPKENIFIDAMKQQNTREALQTKLDEVNNELDTRNERHDHDQYRLNKLCGMQRGYSEAIELLTPAPAPLTEFQESLVRIARGQETPADLEPDDKMYCPDTPTRKASKNKVAEIVTKQLIDRMKASGRLPWRKPWTSEGVPQAINYVTRKAYKGINRMMLEPGEYLSFKQVQAAGGTIIKGRHAHLVIFSKPLFAKSQLDENGDPKTKEDGTRERPYKFMLRYYNVFALEDVDGVESKLKPLDPLAVKIQPNAKAQAIIDNYIHIQKGLTYTEKPSDRAFYSPSADSITVPSRGQYDHAAEFYSTNFHESAHSTGHSTRLDRKFGQGHHSEAYSKEELVAEITAAFLCRECRLDTTESFDNSAAYIQGWSEKLANDENMVIIASAQAEKAYNYIMTDFDETTVKNDPEIKRESFTLTTDKPMLKPEEQGKNIWRVVHEKDINKYLVVNQGGYVYANREFMLKRDADMLLEILINGELEALQVDPAIIGEAIDTLTTKYWFKITDEDTKYVYLMRNFDGLIAKVQIDKITGFVNGKLLDEYLKIFLHGAKVKPEPTPTPTKEENAPETAPSGQQTLLYDKDKPSRSPEGENMMKIMTDHHPIHHEINLYLGLFMQWDKNVKRSDESEEFKTAWSRVVLLQKEFIIFIIQNPFSEELYDMAMSYGEKVKQSLLSAAALAKSNNYQDIIDVFQCPDLPTRPAYDDMDLNFILDQLTNSMEFYNEKEFIEHFWTELNMPPEIARHLYNAYWNLSAHARTQFGLTIGADFIGWIKLRIEEAKQASTKPTPPGHIKRYSHEQIHEMEAAEIIEIIEALQLKIIKLEGK